MLTLPSMISGFKRLLSHNISGSSFVLFRAINTLVVVATIIAATKNKRQTNTIRDLRLFPHVLLWFLIDVVYMASPCLDDCSTSLLFIHISGLGTKSTRSVQEKRLSIAYE
jgi:hypothetical protein